MPVKILGGTIIYWHVSFDMFLVASDSSYQLHSTYPSSYPFIHPTIHFKYLDKGKSEEDETEGEQFHLHLNLFYCVNPNLQS